MSESKSYKRNRGNGEGTIFKRQAGGPWYISWYVAGGKRKSHCTKTTDKATAQRILADKLAEVALRREGIIDPRQEGIVLESAKPIEAHLADFEAMMNARQGSEGHVNRTLLFNREVCTAAIFEKPSDITADGMNRIMASMKAAGKAARTIQARVVACKAFTRWLADHAKLSHDPLRSVKRPSVKTDRKLRRRMMTPMKWPYVRAATLTSGLRDGMRPLERVALYAVAIQTGLRSGELRSLTKVDLFLAGDTPYIRCRAENTKNKQEARQHIQPDLAAELRRIVATKTPTAPVFTMPSEWDVADMLRADLTAARKQWLDEVKHDPDARAEREESDFLAVTNDQGEELDFHALRHTCGSWLALQGVHPNIIKTVMRHSTITLTMDTYGHLLPDQHAEAVGGMVNMLAGPEPEVATGTAGATAVQTAVGMRSGPQDNASGCGAVRDEGKGPSHGEEHKPLRIAEICETVREDATSRGRIRTGTGVTPQGILSPQCLPFHHAAVFLRQASSYVRMGHHVQLRQDFVTCRGEAHRCRSVRQVYPRFLLFHHRTARKRQARGKRPIVTRRL
jgi:integrase